MSSDPLEHYREVPDELLDPSTRRALLIADHFDMLAGTTDVVSTADVSLEKHHPAPLKARLSELEGTDLLWAQVYRAMRRLAELSDQYQYLERPRDDDEYRQGTAREIHRVQQLAADGGDRP